MQISFDRCIDTPWQSPKWNIIQLWRKRTIASFNLHMNRSQTCYTKQKNLVSKSYMLCDSIFSGKSKNTGAENRPFVAKGSLGRVIKQQYGEIIWDNGIILYSICAVTRIYVHVWTHRTIHQEKMNFTACKFWEYNMQYQILSKLNEGGMVHRFQRRQVR